MGVVRTFWLPDHKPCILEITYSDLTNHSHLRFWVQQFKDMHSDDMVLLCDNYAKIVNLSSDTPAVLTIEAKPFANLLYLKGAFSYLVLWHAIEAMKPGWWQ